MAAAAEAGGWTAILAAAVAAANGGRRQRVVAETSPKQGKNRGEESRAARGEEGQAPATLAETAASR